MLDSVRTAQDLWRARMHIPESLCEVLGDITTHNSVRRKERKQTSREGEKTRGPIKMSVRGADIVMWSTHSETNQPTEGGGAAGEG